MRSRLVDVLIVALCASTASAMLLVPDVPDVEMREIEQRQKQTIPLTLGVTLGGGTGTTAATLSAAPTTDSTLLPSSSTTPSTSAAATTASSSAPPSTSSAEQSTTSAAEQSTSSSPPSTTASATTSSEQQAITVTQVITTTNSNGSPTSYTTQSTISPPASLSDPQSSTSGMSTSTRNTVIGVVVGVGGFIILAAIALVIWRVWGRKRGQDESDGLMGYGDGGAYNAADKPESGAGGGSASGRTPFQSTLESYHAPTQVNQASNF